MKTLFGLPTTVEVMPVLQLEKELKEMMVKHEGIDLTNSDTEEDLEMWFYESEPPVYSSLNPDIFEFIDFNLMGIKKGKLYVCSVMNGYTDDGDVEIKELTYVSALLILNQLKSL